MGDDLVWMDLTSLAEEKYPESKREMDQNKTG